MDNKRKTLAEQFDEEIGDTYKAPLRYAERLALEMRSNLVASLSKKQLILLTEYEKALRKMVLLLENESFSRGAFTAKKLN